MKKIYTFFNNISLKYKLIMLFLIVSLIPIFIISIISANNTATIIKERAIDNEFNNLLEIQKNLSSTMSQVELISIKIYLDNNIQQLFDPDKELNETEKIKYEFEIKKRLFSYDYVRYLQGTNSIFLFNNTGGVYSNKDNLGENISSFSDRYWFKDAANANIKYFWGDPESAYGNVIVPYVRIIPDILTSETIGVEVIALKESLIRASYNNKLTYSKGNYCITNNRNIVVSSSRDTYIGRNIADILGAKQDAIKKRDGYFESKIDTKTSLILFKQDPYTRWGVYCIMPLDDIAKASENTNFTAILLSAISVIICFLISMFLSNRVTRPINKLISLMRQTEQGSMDVRFSSDYDDEIGKLGNSFDRMLKRLKKSMDDTIHMQNEKREAELRVLEFQINPHFLYNTLYSIIWLAKENRNEDVIRISKALSNFFRIGISRGREFILVEEEIDHVKNYLDIQRIRYSDEISFVYDLDMDIMHYYTIKLILQPIVENAIYHGVKSLEDKRGVIKLEGFKKDEKIIFRVYDNGEELDEARMALLNGILSGELSGPEDFGIGIRNVRDRIKLNFGNSYGLHFEKQKGYTVVQIELPLLTKEDIDV